MAFMVFAHCVLCAFGSILTSWKPGGEVYTKVWCPCLWWFAMPDLRWFVDSSSRVESNLATKSLTAIILCVGTNKYLGRTTSSSTTTSTSYSNGRPRRWWTPENESISSKAGWLESNTKCYMKVHKGLTNIIFSLGSEWEEEMNWNYVSATENQFITIDEILHPKLNFQQWKILRH